MTKAQQAAVRDYLISLRDPSALRADDAIADLQAKIGESDDALERLTLRQQLLELKNPPLEQYEAEFVKHAKPRSTVLRSLVVGWAGVADGDGCAGV